MVGRILRWLHDFHHLLYIHFCLVIQWNCLCLKLDSATFLHLSFLILSFLICISLGQCGVNKRRPALSLSFKHKCPTPRLSHGVIATPYIEQLWPGVTCRLGMGEGRTATADIPIPPLNNCSAACSAATRQSLWWNYRHSMAADVYCVRTEPWQKMKGPFTKSQQCLRGR